MVELSHSSSMALSFVGWKASWIFEMGAHNRIPALAAHKPSLRAIVRSAMNVVDDTGREFKSGPQRRQIKAALEVGPFAAVSIPRLAAAGLPDTTRQDFVLQSA
jgi:hypothetical protein